MLRGTPDGNGKAALAGLAVEGFPEEVAQEKLGESIPGRGNSMGKGWEGGQGMEGSGRTRWLEGMREKRGKAKGFHLVPRLQ